MLKCVFFLEKKLPQERMIKKDKQTIVYEYE